MKIGIWLESNQWGGVDTHLRNMIRSWTIEDQLVLFSNHDNPGLIKIVESIESKPNVCIVRYRSLPKLGTLSRFGLESCFLPVFFWLSDLRFRRIINKSGPFDGFISDNGGYPGSWTTLAAARAAYKCNIEKRLLLIHHDSRSRKAFRQNIEQVIDLQIPKWCPRIIAVSFATRQSLIMKRDIDLNRCSIVVVPNSVDSENYSTIGSELSIRELCGINEGESLVGTLGRLDAYKGHDELVIAISQLPQEIQNRLHLCIIGGEDSSRVEQINKIAKEFHLIAKIHFLGYLDFHSQKIIETLDILVSATQSFEAFGLTIAEAINAGVLVLATDVGGVSEFFTEDDGLLVPPGDIDSLTEGLSTLIEKTNKSSKNSVRKTPQSNRFDPREMSKKISRELKR